MILDPKDKRFIGAFNHFSLRLKERFNEEITYEQFLASLIRKRSLPKNYINKYVRYSDGEKVYVYAIYREEEIPITVYKLDRFNKGRILCSL